MLSLVYHNKVNYFIKEEMKIYIIYVLHDQRGSMRLEAIVKDVDKGIHFSLGQVQPKLKIFLVVFATI